MHRVLSFVRRMADQLERLLTLVGASLLALVSILAGTEIILRTVFRSSSIEVVSLSMQLAILMIFIGYPALLNGGRDIRMDFIFVRLPRPVQRILAIATELAIFGFFVLLLTKSIDLLSLSARLRHPVFPVSNAIVVLPAVIGAGLGLLVAARRVLDAVVGEETGAGEDGGVDR